MPLSGNAEIISRIFSEITGIDLVPAPAEIVSKLPLQHQDDLLLVPSPECKINLEDGTVRLNVLTQHIDGVWSNIQVGRRNHNKERYKCTYFTYLASHPLITGIWLSPTYPSKKMNMDELLQVAQKLKEDIPIFGEVLQRQTSSSEAQRERKFYNRRESITGSRTPLFDEWVPMLLNTQLGPDAVLECKPASSDKTKRVLKVAPHIKPGHFKAIGFEEDEFQFSGLRASPNSPQYVAVTNAALLSTNGILRNSPNMPTR